MLMLKPFKLNDELAAFYSSTAEMQEFVYQTRA
jgi:hypothetical protein